MSLETYMQTLYTASNRLALLGVTKDFEKWSGLKENTERVANTQVSDTFTYSKCLRFEQFGLVERGEIPRKNNTELTARAFRTTSLGEEMKIAALYHNKFLIDYGIQSFDLVVSNEGGGDVSATKTIPRIFLGFDSVDELGVESNRLSQIIDMLHPEYVFKTNSFVRGKHVYKVFGETTPKRKRSKEFLEYFKMNKNRLLSPVTICEEVDPENPDKAYMYLQKNMDWFLQSGVLERVEPLLLTLKGYAAKQLMHDLKGYFDGAKLPVVDDYISLYENPPRYVGEAYEFHRERSVFRK